MVTSALLHLQVTGCSPTIFLIMCITSVLDHFLSIPGAGPHHRRHRGEAREVLHMGKGYVHGGCGDEEEC